MDMARGESQESMKGVTEETIDTGMQWDREQEPERRQLSWCVGKSQHLPADATSNEDPAQP